MNLGELCSDVYVHTNRPDLESETKLAIRTAARKFHLQDFYMRDMQEKLVNVSDDPSDVFSLSIPDNFTNWRKFNYIRPYDVDASAIKNYYVNPVNPAAIFDEFNRQKTNVYYVAGTKLQIKMAADETGFIISWFSFPDLSENSFSSWIADMYPEILIEEASGRILHIIGMVDEGNKFVDPRIGTIYHPITGHLQALRANELAPNV